MSTSALVAYRDPNRRQPYGFQRNACFGQMNRLSGSQTTDMEVMEWHPNSRGNVGANLRNTCTPRKAFKFINSFGMWQDIFRVTPINTVAATLSEHPMDAIITGFMSMRDYQERGNGFLFNNGELDDKIDFALRSAGIYQNRYGSPFLTLGSTQHGESGVCGIPPATDALSLYLLVYGTPEEFQGCWAQDICGHGSNVGGYVRDSSSESYQRQIRSRRPTWRRMSDWLAAWLATNPEHLQSKLGRLTVQRFYDGLNARLNAEPSSTTTRKAEIITNAFEELRELYA